MFGIPPEDEQKPKSIFGVDGDGPEEAQVQDAKGFLTKMDPVNSQALIIAGLQMLDGNPIGKSAISGIEFAQRVKQQSFRNDLVKQQQDETRQQRTTTNDFREQQLGLSRDSLEATTEGNRLSREATADKARSALGLSGAKLERDFRKDFQAESKDFITQNNAYGRIIAANEKPSAAGDLALIFGFMKVQDPLSVVRESEFRTAEGARGALQRANASGQFVPAAVQGLIDRVLTGRRLTEVQRKDFVDVSTALYSDAASLHQGRESEFTRLSELNGLRTDIVVGDSIIRPGVLGDLSKGAIRTANGSQVEFD